jgi:hypothetical protein
MVSPRAIDLRCCLPNNKSICRCSDERDNNHIRPIHRKIVSSFSHALVPQKGGKPTAHQFSHSFCQVTVSRLTGNVVLAISFIRRHRLPLRISQRSQRCDARSPTHLAHALQDESAVAIHVIGSPLQRQRQNCGEPGSLFSVDLPS